MQTALLDLGVSAHAVGPLPDGGGSGPQAQAFLDQLAMEESLPESAVTAPLPDLTAFAAPFFPLQISALANDADQMPAMTEVTSSFLPQDDEHTLQPPTPISMGRPTANSTIEAMPAPVDRQQSGERSTNVPPAEPIPSGHLPAPAQATLQRSGTLSQMPILQVSAQSEAIARSAVETAIKAQTPETQDIVQMSEGAAEWGDAKRVHSPANDPMILGQPNLDKTATGPEKANLVRLEPHPEKGNSTVQTVDQTALPPEGDDQSLAAQSSVSAFLAAGPDRPAQKLQLADQTNPRQPDLVSAVPISFVGQLQIPFAPDQAVRHPAAQESAFHLRLAALPADIRLADRKVDEIRALEPLVITPLGLGEQGLASAIRAELAPAAGAVSLVDAGLSAAGISALPVGLPPATAIPMSHDPGLTRQSDAPTLMQQTVAILVPQDPRQPGQIELTLTPETLGRLHFDMRPEGDAMAITLSAERPETLELMRRHLPELLAELRQAGLQAGTLSFGTWSEGRQPPEPPHPAPAPDIDFMDATPIRLEPTAHRPNHALAGGLDLRL